MIVDIKKIPVFWNTCRKTLDQRGPRITQVFNTMGIEDHRQVTCEITEPYYVGLAAGHVYSLSNPSLPTMVMEDDAFPISGNEKTVFVVPDGTDALYLGTTTWGRVSRRSINRSVISKDLGEDYLRIYNMLALHAVVYLSNSYAHHVRTLMQEYMDRPIGACDDAVADTMHNYNVIALKRPVFFQDDGKANQCTSEPIYPTFL